jgi:6-methylsalicylate decarboxylase
VVAPGLIDVHHHFLPERYREAVERAGPNPPDGIARLPDWSESSALRLLDTIGIERAYLSISSPGVLLEGSDATEIARIANDTATDLIARNPERFGCFAALPLPDVEASLAELTRALDDLHLDGVGLLTHHGDVYLGDPALDPVFDELDRRASIVFIHPTSPLCCQQSLLDIPAPFLEFIFDTSRAVANLIYSGTLDRCPHIRWIIPHGGGALPALSLRLDGVRGDRNRASDRAASYLRRFHYDLAGPRSDAALGALLGIADPGHLLYGSDWPFTPEPGIAAMRGALETTSMLGSDALDFLTANARRLLGQ